MWYIYTMECYLAIKKKEIVACIDLEITILSKISDRVKDKHHMLSLTCGTLKKKKDVNEVICRTETDSDFEKVIVTKGTGWGEERGRLVVWDGNVLRLDCDNGCTTINIKFIELK